MKKNENMDINKLADTINRLLPPWSAMNGDRIGLQIQSDISDVRRVLVAVEITDEVVIESISKNIDLIITFHPLIYNSLTDIKSSDRVGKLITSLIINKIAVISVHTTFDSYKYGTSRILSDKLGLKFVDYLIPNKESNEIGFGVISETTGQISPSEFLEKVSSITNSPVRFSVGAKDSLSLIAIVGGSGSSFIDDAYNLGADAYITADLTYHQFHKMKGKMMLIDPGHFEMEQFVSEGLYNLFKQNQGQFDDVDFLLSETYTNPVDYYINSYKSDKNINNIINKSEVV